MKTPLSPTVRRELRAKAHSLSPIVAIGNEGLTAAVLKEIDAAVIAHELLKIRVFHDERGAREAFLHEMCEQLSLAPVQHIGKILVVYRHNAEKAKAAKLAAAKKASMPKPPRLTKREEEAGLKVSAKRRRTTSNN